MAQPNKLSNREWEVVNLLLQGKSNKLIASSLGISDRTVEFHLKNIYAKYQVSSRVELILKLGNTTGKAETQKLGHSTVDNMGKTAENRDKFSSRMNWATSFRETVSIIGKESEMKKLLNLKHLLVGITTALSTGFLWLIILSLWQHHGFRQVEVKAGFVPLITSMFIIGFSVGLIGKRNGASLLKVGLSTLLGAGLSPLTIIPLMLVVVLPIGKFAEWLGLIDPSTMSNDFATTLAVVVMITVWLVVGEIIGIIAIGNIKKPERSITPPRIPENGL
jgi:DNA-binding CsgD family transcriptional regulator